MSSNSFFLSKFLKIIKNPKNAFKKQSTKLHPYKAKVNFFAIKVLYLFPLKSIIAMKKGELDKIFEFLFDNRTVRVGACLYYSNKQSVSELQEFMHSEELEYIKNLSSKKRVSSYLMGRYAAKKAYSLLDSSTQLNKLSIGMGISGFPILTGTKTQNLRLSISHTDEAAVGICFNERFLLEIDIEKIDNDMISTIEQTLSTTENKILNAHTKSKNEVLFHHWTAKEALTKIFRTGLAFPYEILEVSKLKFKDNLMISEFSNFDSFVAVSQIIDKHILTMVFHRDFKAKAICF